MAKVKNIAGKRICLFHSDIIDKENTTAVRTEHSPVKAGYCADFDEPWEGEIGHPNILYDDGIYRMYYMVGKRIDLERISAIDSTNREMLKKVVDETVAEGFKVCCLESKDGINWTKPVLNICEFKGSTKNNIILKKAVEFFVMKDTNPDCREGERYKAFYQIGHRLYSMFSDDGLHFKEGGLVAENGGLFDTLNTVHYDENRKQYVAFVRGFHAPDWSDYPDNDDKDALKFLMFPFWKDKDEERRLSPRRDIRVMYSNDFITWTYPKRIEMDNDEGHIQYYTNEIFRYPRATQYYIGFPARYNEFRFWDKSYENLCGWESRQLRYTLEQRYALGISDCMFISSTDTLRWEKSDDAFVRPGIERPDGWIYGDCFFSPSLIETKNTIYTHKEYSLYCAEGTWGHRCRLMRYTIRLDGFVSYHAGREEKKLKTKPFTFAGDKLFMNLSTSVYGSVKVTLKAEDGNEVVSGEVFGDEIEKEIWFEDENALKKIAGKMVEMTVSIKEADVYSFRFA